MSKTGLHEFDEALHTANVWLKDLMEVLGWTEPTQAHQALKIVMHEVRDRLPVPLAANFSSQMPLIIRGIFFEGWSPGSERPTDRSLEAFLAPVATAFRNFPGVRADVVVAAVFEVLSMYISPGEIENVIQALPKPIRDLGKSSIRTSPIAGL
tara:strand:- start:2094 stop:2552 length:459 start_codon:yes stop_codon:yes gene_type:complete